MQIRRLPSETRRASCLPASQTLRRPAGRRYGSLAEATWQRGSLTRTTARCGSRSRASFPMPHKRRTYAAQRSNGALPLPLRATRQRLHASSGTWAHRSPSDHGSSGPRSRDMTCCGLGRCKSSSCRIWRASLLATSGCHMGEVCVGRGGDGAARPLVGVPRRKPAQRRGQGVAVGSHPGRSHRKLANMLEGAILSSSPIFCYLHNGGFATLFCENHA